MAQAFYINTLPPEERIGQLAGVYDCSHELSKLEVFVAVSSSSSRMGGSSFRNELNGVSVVVLSLFAAVPKAVDVRLGHVGLG